MKMTALMRVQGVTVLAGKGKGGRTAFVGDVFEASEKDAERLIEKDAAEEYKVVDRLEDAGETAPAKAPAKKAPAKKAPAKKAPAKKAPTDAAGDDGSDSVSDEELGL